jgi:arylsulfatase A-like enzyme
VSRAEPHGAPNLRKLPVPDRPNILYIHSHDTGRYIQPYGYAVPTPNIQRLAEQGVLFRQAFCGGPTCSPSRAALLTGTYPHNNGMIGHSIWGAKLKDYGHHIGHTLREAGYRSTLIGVQHVAKDLSIEGSGAVRDAADIGYDEVVPLENYHAGNVCRLAAQFLEAGPAEPFFLSVGTQETHLPFRSPGPKEDPRYCRPADPIPDAPETRRDMAGFKASARHFDQGVGALMEALEAAGLARSTLVICTTDHGAPFPAMKCNLTDHGIGVFLIVRGPSGFDGGRVIEALVSQIDLFPTLCELLRIEPPTWLQGTSLMPLVRGEVEDVHEAIFAEMNYHGSYEPLRCVRTRRWKYIRRFEERERHGGINCDDSATMRFWLEHGWADRPVPREELYDLIFDPNEANNVAGDPSLNDVLAEMRGRLEAWMQETEDPLLQGPIPRPEGAGWPEWILRRKESRTQSDG